MGRPKTITDEQILDAARALFLESGHVVPTSTIAKAAGVSEGTIFKRFTNKRALFEAAMGIRSEDLVDRAAPYFEKGEVREGIRVVAEDLLSMFRRALPRMMRMWAHPDCDPKLVMGGKEAVPPPVRIMRAVAGVFAEAADSGFIACREPMMPARMIAASMHQFAFFEMVGIADQLPGDETAYIEALVELIWSGVEPKEPT